MRNFDLIFVKQRVQSDSDEYPRVAPKIMECQNDSTTYRGESIFISLFNAFPRRKVSVIKDTGYPKKKLGHSAFLDGKKVKRC